MFGIFGQSEDLRSENKALVARLKEEDRIIENLRNQLDDIEHAENRSHQLEVRRIYEEHEDYCDAQCKKYEKDLERVNEEKLKLEKECQDKIYVLTSKIRQLELAAEEEKLDVELQIEQALLEHSKNHLEDLTKEQVKIAKLEGDVKAKETQIADMKRYMDGVLALVEAYSDNHSDLLEALTQIAPKMSLKDMNFTVNVPSQNKFENKQTK